MAYARCLPRRPARGKHRRSVYQRCGRMETGRAMLPIWSDTRTHPAALPVGRICLVCPYSWSTPGGVQVQVAGLAQALRRRGAQVDVLAPAEAASDGVTVVGRALPIP